MTEEDEAFNEIERRSIAKKEAVKSSVDAKEALTKLLIDSYDQGVKDALESVTQTSNELQVAGYERGFIDGMQKQAQSSVDKAVNAMSQRTEQEPVEPTEKIYKAWEILVGQHKDLLEENEKLRLELVKQQLIQESMDREDDK